jgi:hypothetical protein
MALIPPVDHLIASSQPRQGDPLGWLMGATVVAMVVLFVVNMASGDQNGGATAAVWLIVMGLFAASFFVRAAKVKRIRREHAMLEAAEEMIQLRQWPQGAGLLTGVLSVPMSSHQARVQALMYMTTVLARAGRFEDVVSIHEYLLATVPMTEASIHAVRLGRAMAILREDRMFDADRAISELRRSPVAEDSPGLALVEIYRDVKTGHHAEAIAEFRKRFVMLRDQLGHRAADAWILLAKALHMSGQTTEAAAAVTSATLLAPAGELSRRYPEVTDLFTIYKAAAAPAGVA